jgi:Xaa-Pro aminopeptidase
MSLPRAKLDQAAGLMERHGLDCWIVQFARETGLRPDPLAYLVGVTTTWPSAFLLNRDGRTAAIVGTGDSGQVEAVGLWDEVRGYVASPRDDLVSVLESWAPKTIGVSWSESDDTSDGITFGMYRMLESLLEGTRYKERLKQAGDLAGQVRSRKLPEEVEGIHSAIAFTEQLFARIEIELRPGVSEIQLQRLVQGWVHEAGFAFSWEERMNPMVDFGPRPGPLGHTLPGNVQVGPGQLIHVDLGVLRDGFASDLQRTWYWLRDGESQAPEPVLHAFAATRASIDAGMAALKPGRAGHEVDAESRRTIVDAGFPEPGFAFGHHVGRVAHDGAGVLGPRWERYGSAPDVVIEPDNVFAVEMDLDVPGYGLVGLEEEVVVERDGARYLSKPQRELWLLPTRGRAS